MINIKKNGVITNSGPNQEWLDKHLAMGTFGCPASQNEDGSWNPAEYSIEEVDDSIKSQDQINMEARAYLASTDWYLIRSLELGPESIPESVLSQRAEARENIK